MENTNEKIDNQNKNGTWECPYCNDKLTKDVDREYETLLDHVTDPNYEGNFPLRPTFVCKNKLCKMNHEVGFYGEDGDFYPTKVPVPIIPVLPAKYSLCWDCENKKD